MVCTIITPAYAAGIFLPEESNTKQAESTDLIEAPSGILMEAQTGTVVYQKDADTRRSPASITKIMTLILIFDALDKGSLKMDDTVTTVPMQSPWAVLRCFWRRGKSRQWKP